MEIEHIFMLGIISIGKVIILYVSFSFTKLFLCTLYINADVFFGQLIMYYDNFNKLSDKFTIPFTIASIYIHMLFWL